MTENSKLHAAPKSDFLNAMAKHVSSVCLITTMDGGTRFGLTATAVASVCADPPRLLVCVNKSGITHEKMMESKRFAVNVLTEDQDAIAIAFATPTTQEERFATGSWITGTTGSPVLSNAAASFDCIVSGHSDQDTHTVFFGDVVEASHEVDTDALLYGGQRFRQLRRIISGRSDQT